MASEATRLQTTVCALLKGFVDMFVEQRLGGDPAFMALAGRVTAVWKTAVEVLESEPAGRLKRSEVRQIKSRVDRFRARSFARGLFLPEHAISMCICMITDQLAHIRNAKKRAAFEALLSEAENLIVYFDPECKYESAEGYSAAMVYEEIS